MFSEIDNKIKRFFSLKSEQQELLKYLAIIAMVMDHIGMLYFNGEHYLLNTAGRFVFPAFAFMLVYNYIHYTKNKPKYLLKIIATGVISQPIYSYTFDRDIFHLNIMFSLFTGLFFIMAYEKFISLDLPKDIIKKWIINILVMLVALTIFLIVGRYLSYFWFGPLMISMFYGVLKTKSLIFLPGLLISLFLLNIAFDSQLKIVATFGFFIVFWMVKQSNFKLKRLNAAFFYLFYPLHFIVLKVIHILV